LTAAAAAGKVKAPSVGGGVMARRRPPEGPERTDAGEPVWVLEWLGRTNVVGLATDRVYITEGDDSGKAAVKAMKRGATVADALADAEVQVPLGKVERVWSVGKRNSLHVRWQAKGGRKEFHLMCEAGVRDEIFDELDRALGDGFVRVERKLSPGEVIALPLGCLGIAVVVAALLAVFWGGMNGYMTAGGLVLMGVAYVAIVLAMPETVTELVPAD
jgi:hypothetical protein